MFSQDQDTIINGVKFEFHQTILQNCKKQYILHLYIVGHRQGIYLSKQPIGVIGHTGQKWTKIIPACVIINMFHYIVQLTDHIPT